MLASCMRSEYLTFAVFSDLCVGVKCVEYVTKVSRVERGKEIVYFLPWATRIIQHPQQEHGHP